MALAVSSNWYLAASPPPTATPSLCPGSRQHHIASCSHLSSNRCVHQARVAAALPPRLAPLCEACIHYLTVTE